jgi:solute carrier family 35, member E3
MTKLAIIPFTVLLETIFLKKKFRLFIKLAFFFHLFRANITSVVPNLVIVSWEWIFMA